MTDLFDHRVDAMTALDRMLERGLITREYSHMSIGLLLRVAHASLALTKETARATAKQWASGTKCRG